MARKTSSDKEQLEAESVMSFSQFRNVSVYGRPEMDQLTNWIGAKASSDWYLIGVQLKFSTDKLDEIKANGTGKTVMLIFCDVMKLWESDPQPGASFNWETILDALASSSIGRVALAREVAAKICQIQLKNIDEDSDDSGTSSNGYYTNDDLKKLCRCGECSISVIITKGCKKSDVLTQFPILDVKKLDQCKRQQYLCMLEEESQQMNKSFAILSDNICQSLITRKIDVKRVVNFVLRLYLKPLGSTSSPSVMCGLQKKLEDAKDMEEVFIVLHKITSWFNHQPLEFLVEQFELKDVEIAYKKFTEDIIAYLQRSITEIPKDAFGSEIEGAGEFRLKLVHPKTPHEELTGNQVYKIKRSVASAFDIKIECLHLFSVDDGCFELKFNIPLAIYDNLFFPFSKRHAQGLAEILIVGRRVTFHLSSIRYDGCYHDLPLKPEKATTSTSAFNLFIANDIPSKPELIQEKEISVKPEPLTQKVSPLLKQKKLETPGFPVVAVISHLSEIIKAAEHPIIEFQTILAEAKPSLSRLHECKDFIKFREVKDFIANLNTLINAAIKYLQKGIMNIFKKMPTYTHHVLKINTVDMCAFTIKIQKAVEETKDLYRTLEGAIQAIKKSYQIAESKKEEKLDETDSMLLTEFPIEHKSRTFPAIKGEQLFKEVTEIFARLEKTLFFATQSIINEYAIEQKFTEEEILSIFRTEHEHVRSFLQKLGRTVNLCSQYTAILSEVLS